MRNLLIAAFAAIGLLVAGCATTVDPATSILTMECKSGQSVKDFLHDQQVQYPDYNVHIENVVTGDAVAAMLGQSTVEVDAITVLGAVLKGEPSTGVLVVFSKNGCVIGQQFLPRDVAIDKHLLPAQTSQSVETFNDWQG